MSAHRAASIFRMWGVFTFLVTVLRDRQGHCHLPDDKAETQRAEKEQAGTRRPGALTCSRASSGVQSELAWSMDRFPHVNHKRIDVHHFLVASIRVLPRPQPHDWSTTCASTGLPRLPKFALHHLASKISSFLGFAPVEAAAP